MPTMICPTCGNTTWFRRQFGIGTLILILVTAGFWILALPFYRKRCPICGTLEQDALTRLGLAK
jgi:hypothetical protein